MGRGIQYVGGVMMPILTDAELAAMGQQLAGVAPSETAIAPAFDVERAPADTVDISSLGSLGRVAPKPPSLPVAPPAVASKPGAVVTPKNIVRAAKARVKEIERDLKRLAALQVERDQLRRLIAAAEGKPVGVVVGIAKKSAG